MSYYQPAPLTTWQIQLQYEVNENVEVSVFDIDLFDVNETQIVSIQTQDRFVICYFSAGSYEDWRPDADDFDSSDIGNPLDGWPGEYWLDTNSINVRDIMSSRLDLAVSKGCDGVDPDNVEAYLADSGFSLTYEDQIDYNTFLATEAHSRNLFVCLKNDLSQLDDLSSLFDCAINEECMEYNECDYYANFSKTKAVFAIEYDVTDLDAACDVAATYNMSLLVKNYDLDDTRCDCSGNEETNIDCDNLLSSSSTTTSIFLAVIIMSIMSLIHS